MKAVSTTNYFMLATNQGARDADCPAGLYKSAEGHYCGVGQRGGWTLSYSIADHGHGSDMSTFLYF